MKWFKDLLQGIMTIVVVAGRFFIPQQNNKNNINNININNNINNNNNKNDHDDQISIIIIENLLLSS